MQNSSPDNLPSLSATCPTTTHSDSPEKGSITLKGCHDATMSVPSFFDTQTKPAKKSATTTKAQESALRATKKEISEKVREDWEWPPSPSAYTSFVDADMEKTKEWRERDSDSEYSPPSPVSNSDPYRFDSPESIPQHTLSRKRKRRKMLQEEMTWNEGLRTFMERRDAWSGARVGPISTISDIPVHDPPTSPIQHTTSYTTHTKSYLPSPPLPSPPIPHPSPSPFSPSNIPESSSSYNICSAAAPLHPQPSTTLIPLPAPILPSTHPIRASIYDKIILRGLSPTIPINLKDVTLALVAGWKKDGEWPPKGDGGGTGDGDGVGGEGRREGGKRLARRGVGRVKRVLGLRRGGAEEERECEVG